MGWMIEINSREVRIKVGRQHEPRAKTKRMRRLEEHDGVRTLPGLGSKYVPKGRLASKVPGVTLSENWQDSSEADHV